MLLRVYQGESRRTEENLLLGDMQVTGIPPGPAGQPVIVRFTYDLNGLLEVEALVPGTDQRFVSVLRQDVAGLTGSELAEARERMQRLKFYPRDQLDNQRLLRRAESVLKELDALERNRLERIVDDFESALDSGDRTYFGTTRLELLVKLSALGFPFETHEDRTSE